jgi:hypothetical protein
VAKKIDVHKVVRLTVRSKPLLLDVNDLNEAVEILFASQGLGKTWLSPCLAAVSKAWFCKGTALAVPFRAAIVDSGAGGIRSNCWGATAGYQELMTED